MLGDPLPCVPGRLRGVLQHEMRRLLVALHVRVRQAGPQVAQVAVGEHRVARPPQQQHRHVVELADLLGDPVQRRALGRPGPSGMSATNSSTACRRCADPYGAANAARTAAGSGGRDSAVAARTNSRRRRAHRVPQRRCPGQPDQRGRRRPRRLVHRGVGGRLQPVAVPDGPAQRHRPAPVVPGRHHRPVDAQRVEHGVEVVHPLRQRARHTPLREPHPELVDGHHPPARRRRDEPPPQVRPRRVAVDAHQRALLGRADVQHVPLVPAGVGDQPRPGRIQAGQPGRRERGAGHQTSSVQHPFRPDPTPISSTRSPVCSEVDLRRQRERDGRRAHVAAQRNGGTRSESIRSVGTSRP